MRMGKGGIMEKIKGIVYGFGGWDPEAEDENIVEVIYYTDEELAELESDA